MYKITQLELYLVVVRMGDYSRASCFRTLTRPLIGMSYGWGGEGQWEQVGEEHLGVAETDKSCTSQ